MRSPCVARPRRPRKGGCSVRANANTEQERRAAVQVGAKPGSLFDSASVLHDVSFTGSNPWISNSSLARKDVLASLARAGPSPVPPRGVDASHERPGRPLALSRRDRESKGGRESKSAARAPRRARASRYSRGRRAERASPLTSDRRGAARKVSFEPCNGNSSRSGARFAPRTNGRTARSPCLSRAVTWCLWSAASGAGA